MWRYRNTLQTALKFPQKEALRMYIVSLIIMHEFCKGIYAIIGS